jgi:hypothetical protein
MYRATAEELERAFETQTLKREKEVSERSDAKMEQLKAEKAIEVDLEKVVKTLEEHHRMLLLTRNLILDINRRILDYERNFMNESTFLSLYKLAEGEGNE